MSAKSAAAALAWAEKRKAKVDAANARKAQKEMGEVTSDHTFKPKLRSAKVSRSLTSLGSGKITPIEKPNLASPVLKRRPGDVKVDHTSDAVNVATPPKAQERAVPSAKVDGKARSQSPDPEPKTQNAGVPKARPSPTTARSQSPDPEPKTQNAGVPKARPSPTTVSPKRPGVSPRGTAVKPGSPSTPKTMKATKASTPPAKVSESPPSTESAGGGLFCWKDMSHGLTSAKFFPGLMPAVAVDVASEELPDVEVEDISHNDSGLCESDAHVPTSPVEEDPSMDAHLKLERMRQQLEEEQRQLEEEAQQLRLGGSVDAKKLQQLAEKQQQRLARFDKEHEQMESESAWVEDSGAMRLPVITEQPELLEEFQSQHMEEFERMQRHFQQEQVALREKLQDHLQQSGTEEPQLADPVEKDVRQQEVEEAKIKAAKMSKLGDMFRTLQEQQQENYSKERQEHLDLINLIKKLKKKCESLESRVQEPRSPSLFGAFQEFWTTDAWNGTGAGTHDGDWFKSAAGRLADLMATETTPDRTDGFKSDGLSPPQERASSRRWPPGPSR